MSRSARKWKERRAGCTFYVPEEPALEIDLRRDAVCLGGPIDDLQCFSRHAGRPLVQGGEFVV